MTTMTVDRLWVSLIAELVAGNLINWLLLGVLTVQLYLYHLAFPNDKNWLKAAVYIVYALEAIHAIGLGIVLRLMILNSNAVKYQYYQYLQHLPRLTIGTGLLSINAFLVELFGALVPTAAQCIYAHRIQVITQKKVISIPIIALAFLQLSAAIGATMYAVMIPVWAALNVITDLTIAGILVRSLTREKILSDYTKSKVVRITRLIIATGSLTVAANLASFILIIRATDGRSCSVILIVTPKLYANSIMVMLNNRMTIRNQTSRTSATSTSVLSEIVIGDNSFGVTTDDEIDRSPISQAATQKR